jgi:hypothetical protein
MGSKGGAGWNDRIGTAEKLATNLCRPPCDRKSCIILSELRQHQADSFKSDL